MSYYKQFHEWTEAEVCAYNQRGRSGKAPRDAENAAMIARIPDHPAVESEPDLHDEILAFCRERGWIAVHSRMDRKTTQALGVCDFIIAADQGRVFWIECKRKAGKLTVAQKGFAMQLDKLGHECFLVRSMDDFREVVK